MAKSVGAFDHSLKKPARLGSADAALAGLVIAVVGLMVVPLPTWLLDLLIASNLAVSVAILLVSLYVSDALGIAAFPTLLLLTTLRALSLNVSSTRLILLQADAGEVIRAFGSFVVHGNYVVGGVIFLILNIIQFVVIAKGSERVAEVGRASRSTPCRASKWRSTPNSAPAPSTETKRAHAAGRLARESQFYGAMDGAMKFVKGDVIAGFLITLVNLFGGIAIGVGQKDLSLVERSEALRAPDHRRRPGDADPSIVIATAAGILVTRVASEKRRTPLGAELAGQLFEQPRALRVSSLFVFGLAAVPGLPGVPFVVIGLLPLPRLAPASRAAGAHDRAGRRPRAGGPRKQRASLRAHRHPLGPRGERNLRTARRRRAPRRRYRAPWPALGADHRP